VSVSCRTRSARARRRCASKLLPVSGQRAHSSRRRSDALPIRSARGQIQRSGKRPACRQSGSKSCGGAGALLVKYELGSVERRQDGTHDRLMESMFHETQAPGFHAARSPLDEARHQVSCRQIWLRRGHAWSAASKATIGSMVSMFHEIQAPGFHVRRRPTVRPGAAKCWCTHYRLWTRLRSTPAATGPALRGRPT